MKSLATGGLEGSSAYVRGVGCKRQNGNKRPTTIVVTILAIVIKTTTVLIRISLRVILLIITILVLHPPKPIRKIPIRN